MSVEVNPVGMHCERACVYCYELPVRRATRNALPGRVDHEAVQAAVLAEAPGADGFSLFGGEPLLAPLEDLERLFEFGLRRYGKNGVQTDGNVITDAHVELFKRYKVWVGFSIDGPGELNDARVAGTLARTREATARSEAALRRCLAEGIGCSLIVTVHRMNAWPDRLPRLLDWLRDLAAAGLRDARAHALEMDGGASLVALPVPEAVAAFEALDQLGREVGISFDVFRDMEALLRAEDDSVTCTWTGCDPWTTPAVRGIDGDGARSLCQRVHKDGQKWVPAERGPLVRQLVLAETPQEEGGCAGCRFLTACKGQCPGTAIDGDWRKRSADCSLWFALLEMAEARISASGSVPVSLRPDRGTIETRMRSAWANGITASNKGCLEDRYRGQDSYHGQGTEHGDHDDHGDHSDLGLAIDRLAGGEKV